MAATVEDTAPLSLTSVLKRKETELQHLVIPSAWSILELLTAKQLNKRCKEYSNVHVRFATRARPSDNKPYLIEALLGQTTEAEAVWDAVFLDLKCWGVEQLMGYCKRLGLPTTGGEADLQRRLRAHDKTYLANVVEILELRWLDTGDGDWLDYTGEDDPSKKMPKKRRRLFAAKILELMKQAADNDARNVPGMSAAPPHAFKDFVADAVCFGGLENDLVADRNAFLDVARAWLGSVGAEAVGGISPEGVEPIDRITTEDVCVSLLEMAIQARIFEEVHQLPCVPRLLACCLLRSMRFGEGLAEMKELILSLPLDDLARVKGNIEKTAESQLGEGGLLHGNIKKFYYSDSDSDSDTDNFGEADLSKFLRIIEHKLVQSRGSQAAGSPRTPLRGGVSGASPPRTQQAPQQKQAQPPSQQSMVDARGEALFAAATGTGTGTTAAASLPAWLAAVPEHKLASMDVPLALTALLCLTADQLTTLAEAKGIRGLSRKRKPEVAQILLLKDAVKIQGVWEALPPSCRSREKLSEYCTWHGLNGKGSEAKLMKRLVDLETESFRKLSLLQEFKARRPEVASDATKEEIACEVLSLLQAALDTDQRRATGDMHASKSHVVKFYGLADLLALPCLAPHYAANKEFEPVLVCWMQLTLGEGDGDLEMVRFVLVRLAKEDKPLRDRLEQFLVFCQLMALEEGFEGNNADIAKAMRKYQIYASENLFRLREVRNEYREVRNEYSADGSQIEDRIERKVLRCLIKGRKIYLAKPSESKVAKRKADQEAPGEPASKGKAAAKEPKKEGASAQDTVSKAMGAGSQPAVGKAQAKKNAENAYLHKEPLQEAQEPYPILLGCYNFKGGVGKTTIAINVGVALRNAGHRTCYVDCDSQCNLTKYFNTEAEAREVKASTNPQTDYADDDTPPLNLSRASRRPKLGSYHVPDGFLADLNVDVCRKGSFDRNGNAYECTIKEILLSSFLGRSARGTPGILEFAARRDGNDEPMYPDLPDGLFLIPGHQDLGSSLETRFINARAAVHNIGQEDAFMVLGGFRKALTEIAKEHGIKYMVCDFGPSKGVANEVLLASLDMIIPPFMPDFFSASSVAGLLETVMPGLIDHKATVHNRELAARLSNEYAPYTFFDKPTKLLPFLMTNIKVAGPVGNQQMVRDHAVFYNLVERLVQDDGMEIRRDVRALFLRDSDDRMVVPFLKQVTVLVAAAQAIGHPAIALTHDMVSRWYSGNVPPGIMAELRHTAEAFQRLARMVIAVSRRL
eukprot:jgi/Mesvir1/22625/Mv14064-RA.4